MRHSPYLISALLAVLVACAPAAEDPQPAGGGALHPSIAPLITPTPPADGPTREPTTLPTAAPGVGSTPTPDLPQPTPTETPAPRSLTASLSDPTGDVSRGAESPPPYADLVGGAIALTGDTYELRIRLGATAPERTDAEHTMNVASFYDVDGDGEIEYEVWGNLADTGWGPAYFDNTEGRARYGEDADVTVTTDGDELVLRFPATHLAANRSFRWALASEWGRYETLTTPASATDAAPDSGAAPFPGG